MQQSLEEILANADLSAHDLSYYATVYSGHASHAFIIAIVAVALLTALPYMRGFRRLTKGSLGKLLWWRKMSLLGHLAMSIGLVWFFRSHSTVGLALVIGSVTWAFLKTHVFAGKTWEDVATSAIERGEKKVAQMKAKADNWDDI